LAFGYWLLATAKTKSKRKSAFGNWYLVFGKPNQDRLLAFGYWLLVTAKTKSKPRSGSWSLAIGQGKNQNKTHHSGAGDD
jgi:hypothetical protein